MPYKITRKGDQHCVVKESGEAVPGGCHPSRAKATAHMKALYANVEDATKKEALIHEEGVENKDSDLTEDKCGYYDYPYIPSGVVSFSGYETYLKASETAKAYRQQVGILQDLISNIMYSSEVTNKATALKNLLNEFSSRIDGLETKEETPPETDDTSFMVWKEADGSWKWAGIYSNNYEDDDNPKEVISEKAHQSFAALANDGVVPMPELWHWHQEGFRWGVAEHLMVVDGFAVALGSVDSGHESEAEAASQLKGLGMSHGMWKKSIVRDETDPSIIDFYISREISDLPVKKAANKLTGFMVFEEE